MTPNEYLELHIYRAMAVLPSCHLPHSWQPRDITSYLTDALQAVQGARRDQPLDIGDSPSVREPPPVEASPSPRSGLPPRERSGRIDLCSAVSVLADTRLSRYVGCIHDGEARCNTCRRWEEDND